MCNKNKILLHHTIIKIHHFLTDRIFASFGLMINRKNKISQIYMVKYKEQVLDFCLSIKILDILVPLTNSQFSKSGLRCFPFHCVFNPKVKRKTKTTFPFFVIPNMLASCKETLLV